LWVASCHSYSFMQKIRFRCITVIWSMLRHFPSDRSCNDLQGLSRCLLLPSKSRNEQHRQDLSETERIFAWRCTTCPTLEVYINEELTWPELTIFWKL
jgi:hypothetical protein